MLLNPIPYVSDARLSKPHYCFASWTHQDYTFMLLWQQNDDFDMPCIRFPSSAGDKLTAYIFMDGLYTNSTGSQI